MSPSRGLPRYLVARGLLTEEKYKTIVQRKCTSTLIVKTPTQVNTDVAITSAANVLSMTSNVQVTDMSDHQVCTFSIVIKSNFVFQKLAQMSMTRSSALLEKETEYSKLMLSVSSIEQDINQKSAQLLTLKKQADECKKIIDSEKRFFTLLKDFISNSPQTIPTPSSLQIPLESHPVNDKS